MSVESLSKSRLRRLVATLRYRHPKLSPATVATQSPISCHPPSSRLPPELWALIIRYATSYPSLSAWDDEDPHTVSFLSLPYDSPRLLQHRSIMRRKARLTLVCKDWYTYAQEALFEFVWISREKQARLLAGILQWQPQRGRYIRRLHVETPTLERCSATDLRIILDHAPALMVYSDYRSVRRRNIQMIPFCSPASPSSYVTMYSPHTDPASPDSLLAALSRPGNALRRLSWTNYDDASFHLRLSPLLLATGANLEYLELNFCSLPTSAPEPNIDPCPIESTYTTPLTLPSLRTLKVTLDNATFSVLSTWHMPHLRNLSVLAADFSYYSEHSATTRGERTPSGFEQFFLRHGEKIDQLELGHSSSVIEEHWVTAPLQQNNATGSSRIALSMWCPNLTTFICSADAEWNWQNPDWIAPHVLLPAHPGVRLIGIRDIGKRVAEGLQAEGDFFMLTEQIGSLLRREAFPNLLYIRDMSYSSDMLRRGHDMCRDDEHELDRSLSHDRFRGNGIQNNLSISKKMWPLNRLRAGSNSQQNSYHSPSRNPRINSTRQIEDHTKVLRFWQGVLDRCRAGRVWLEDWRGMNITLGDLRRAEAALAKVTSAT